jgi:uncharacterized protein (DUF2147 family)
MRGFFARRVALMGIVVSLAAGVMPGPASAADQTAAGVWEQVNEKTGEAQATITIVKSGPAYVGTITTIYPKPGHPVDPICVNCSGSLKNRPMKGLQIINDMQQSGLEYTGGTILDPESGSVYTANMQLSADGRHLTVRGYVGIPTFGRSQTWNRIR